MEVNDVVVRILRGHWRLWIACLILPVLFVGIAHSVLPREYASAARLQATSLAPASDTEADAVLNRVSGIATSAAVVGLALHDASLNDRTVVGVTPEIVVTRLGSSAVFDLSVTDVDPGVATSLARALATDTVNFLNGVGGPSSKLLNDLIDHQNGLLAQRQQIAARLPLTTDPVASANLSAQLAGIDQQLSQVASSLGQLQFNASGASAVLISQAGAAVPVVSSVVTDIGLAFVLGLVVSLVLASVLEVVRPRVADGRAFSREIGVPLLGRLLQQAPRRRSAGILDSPDGQGTDSHIRGEGTDGSLAVDPELATALWSAAELAGAQTVVLVGPAGSDRLAQLAQAFSAGGDAGRRTAVNGEPVLARSRPSPVPRKVDSARDARRNGDATLGADAGTTVLAASPDARGDRVEQVTGPAPGRPSVMTLRDIEWADWPSKRTMVAVVPDLALYSEVRRVSDLVAATGWPVIGVIAAPKRASRRRRPHLWQRS